MNVNRKLACIMACLMSVSLYGSNDTFPPLEFFVDALIQVESRGDSTAVGDGGKAVGVLQIHPIMVREVNRILNKQGSDKRYEYEDRWSVRSSIEMFHIWRKYYHSNSSYEVMARSWNGGPGGPYSRYTLCYWKKVKNAMLVISASNGL